MLCQIEAILNSAELEDLERLHDAIKSLGHAGSNDVVSEICPLPRVMALAGSSRLSSGFALDTTVIDPDDGQPCVF